MLEKVYGFLANKCKIEVYSKKDFAVLEGDFQVYNNSYGSTYVDFPKGFTKDNCVVISLGLKGNNNNLGFAFGIDKDTDNANNCNVSAKVNVGLATGTEYENKMCITVYNQTNKDLVYRYRLVLMRIDL